MRTFSGEISSTIVHTSTRQHAQMTDLLKDPESTGKLPKLGMLHAIRR